MTAVLLPTARASALARAVVVEGGAGLAEFIRTDGLTAQDATWLAKQGVAAYARYALRKADLLATLPSETRQILEQGYALSAMHEAVQHRETLQRAVGALQKANIPAVVLKGMALAHTVYPAPQTRPKSDLDLWLQSPTLHEAITVLKAAGYQQRAERDSLTPLGLLYDGELGLTCNGGLVELQWPALRGWWVRYAARVDHALMWARRRTVTVDGLTVEILAPEEGLMHVAFHQAINHQFTYPCWLRSLLDVHLLVTRSTVDWGMLVQTARTWGLATVTGAVLHLAQQILATPVPDVVLTQLLAPARRTIVRRLQLDRAILEMWPADYRPRRFAILLGLIDRPVDALRLLYRGVIPEANWLRARYEVPAGARLGAARVRYWRTLWRQGHV